MDHLINVKDSSSVVKEGYIPRYEVIESTDQLVINREICEFNLFNDEAKYYRSIWDLMVHLWGPDTFSNNRREQFSNW